MHISDQELMQALDGELSSRDAARVEAHFRECWTCRARREEMERAISDFVKLPKAVVPSADGPRAMLKAHLAQAAAHRPFMQQSWWLAAAICGVLLISGVLIGQFFWGQTSRVVIVPDPRLTPGATVLASAGEVCSASSEKNRAVPVALQRKVFAAYGIAHAAPAAYEVDYLITPALGGADDIHNLWPQSYSDTVWNAQVKDDLEDHLRELVCAGKLDLATAQREIAGNWIEAYKKYFQTDRPR